MRGLVLQVSFSCENCNRERGTVTGLHPKIFWEFSPFQIPLQKALPWGLIGCTMPTSGYYKTSLKAATVREMVRRRGVLKLPVTFIFMKFFMRPSGGVWMPSTCAEIECRAEELSPRFSEATQPQRAAFAQLGFKPCFHSKLRHNLNPLYLDDEGITYLHSGGSYVGTLVYGKLQVPAPLNQVREVVVVGLTAAFERGSVSFTNSKDHFDPLPGRRSVFVHTADPARIYDQFDSHLGRL